MAVKYSIQYKDVVGNDFVCDIENDDYTGEIILLDGSCELTIAPVENHYAVIRGRSLKIQVLATLELPLSDLWQDDEMYWFCTFQKNNEIRFKGYLSSEDVFEDYNSDRWILNLEAVGPLGVLEDLAYATMFGNPYVGFDNLIQVISNALKPGFSQPSHRMGIKASIDFVGQDQPLDGVTDFYSYANIDQGLFIRDDGETLEDCKTVLIDVLKSLGVVIFQEYGYWYILPLKSAANVDGLAFKEYDSDGDYIGDVVENSLRKQVGSQSVQETNFHVNENQVLTMERSADVFVIRHTSEYNEELLENPDLIQNADPNNPVEGWTLTDNADAAPGGIFIDSSIVNNNTGFGIAETALFADSVTLKENESFIFSTELEYSQNPEYQQFRLRLSNGSENWNLGINNTWYLQPLGFSGAVKRVFLEGERVVKIDIDIPPLPISGNLSIVIYTVVNQDTLGAGRVLNASLKSISGILSGTEYRFNKSQPKKEKALEPDNIRFSTSDNISLRNVFYKPDLITQIETIKPTGLPETDSGKHIVYSRAIMLQNKTRVFTGDVFGDIPYLGNIQYTSIENMMIPIELIYNTYNNTTSIKARKLDTSQTLQGVITKEVVFSETVKPTIIS